jgi:hypothetical protein
MDRSGATLLLRSGFPENPIGADDDPQLAPLALYPVPGRVLIAPSWLNREEDTARMEKVVSSLVQEGSTFVYVAPSDYGAPSTWLLDRLRGERYRSSRLGPFKGMTVIKFAPQ